MNATKPVRDFSLQIGSGASRRGHRSSNALIVFSSSHILPYQVRLYQSPLCSNAIEAVPSFLLECLYEE